MWDLDEKSIESTWKEHKFNINWSWDLHKECVEYMRKDHEIYMKRTRDRRKQYQ